MIFSSLSLISRLALILARSYLELKSPALVSRTPLEFSHNCCYN